MKKLLALLLSLTMVFLVACSGGEKELGTAKYEQGQQAITIKYYGEGDKVNKMEQNTIIKDLTDEQITKLKDGIQKVEDTYKKIKGTTYKSELKDKTFIETLTMDLGNKETLRALVDQNLLQVTDKNLEVVSLEQSLSTLEASGWTVTRNK